MNQWLATILIIGSLLSGLFLTVSAQDAQIPQIEAVRLWGQAERLYAAGRYDEALSLAAQGLAILDKHLSREQSLRRDDVYVSSLLLNTLGKLYRAKDDYERAISTYQRLLTLREKYLGADLPFIAMTLHDLAAVYEAKGDYAPALDLRVRGNDIREQILSMSLSPKQFANSLDAKGASPLESAIETSEAGVQVYLLTIAGETDATISLHVLHAPQNKQAARLAMTTVFQRKGRMLDTKAEQFGVLRRYGNAEDQKLLEELNKLYAREAALSNSSGKGETNDIQEYSRRIGEEGVITSLLMSYESAISMRSLLLQTHASPITFNAVQQLIPSDAALVEMFSYRPFDAKAKTEATAFGPPRYLAYVLRRGEDSPQYVELGDVASLDEMAGRLRDALRDPQGTHYKESARAFDERVMQPVRKLLGTTRRVLLSPDGALNLVPFAALVDESGKYLVENYSISYLTSGRELLRLQSRDESREPPMVIADPLFDLSAGKRPSTSGKQTKQSVDQSSSNPLAKDLTAVNYKALPGTAAEAVALGQLFPNATVFTQERATEAALKKVNRPRLLHIATHGFFLADQTDYEAAKQRGSAGLNWGNEAFTRETIRATQPLLRSGLILAGVKQKASGTDEDGVLTALEAAGLNLIGTKLVVLSACETGLVTLQVGQGVYGLRRALVLAGSETQVMSLWKISDAGTRDLMVAYYKRLEAGEGRTEALRQVQLEMLRGQSSPAVTKGGKRETTDTSDDASAPRDYRHPYYWAAFIPSGDWRSLDGK